MVCRQGCQEQANGLGSYSASTTHAWQLLSERVQRRLELWLGQFVGWRRARFQRQQNEFTVLQQVWHREESTYQWQTIQWQESRLSPTAEQQ